MSNEKILGDLFHKMASDVEGVLKRNLPLFEIAGASTAEMALAVAKIASGAELVAVAFVAAMARNEEDSVLAVQAVRELVDQIVESSLQQTMVEAAVKRAEMMGVGR